MRKTIFANEQFYHIFNRGVDKREVFLDEEDFLRFLTCLREFNSKLIREARAKFSELSSENFPLEDTQPLVEIICYCLNSNHYHLILKQLVENGIKIFMHKLSTGYTNYFNKKYQRSGSLFQGRFKAIHIDSNEYLLLLSAYINRNYFIHGYAGCDISEAKPPIGGLASEISPSEWKYCSAADYLAQGSSAPIGGVELPNS